MREQRPREVASLRRRLRHVISQVLSGPVVNHVDLNAFNLLIRMGELIFLGQKSQDYFPVMKLRLEVNHVDLNAFDLLIRMTDMFSFKKKRKEEREFMSTNIVRKKGDIRDFVELQLTCKWPLVDEINLAQLHITILFPSLRPSSRSRRRAAAAAARFVFESGTAQLRFHYEAMLSNVVVRVDLRSAQVFELGPVESICVDEGSNGGENEKMHTDVLGKMLDSSVSVQPLVKSIQELASAAKLVENKGETSYCCRQRPDAKVDLLELDLGSMASIRKFVHEFNSLGLPLNILMYLESALHAFQGQFGAAFCNKLHCYTSSQILPSFMKKQIVYQRSDHRFAIDSWLDFLESEAMLWMSRID
ncbi:hypothetical protein Sjap_008168 [Stephania japonica]|uniref:Probable histone-arginine methyltransferase CARM1-like N-terminal PH domain-containing protein n=1 Tax=Stephania japonica TaxID=461633 RepID=A0AAP0PC17_9MAGN